MQIIIFEYAKLAFDSKLVDLLLFCWSKIIGMIKMPNLGKLFLAGVILILFTACSDSDPVLESTTVTKAEVFIDLPKSIRNTNVSAMNSIKPAGVISPLALDTSIADPCDVVSVVVPDQRGDTIGIYSGARDLNLLFACNPYDQIIQMDAVTLSDGNKRWWLSTFLFLEAETIVGDKVVKGVFLQDMASTEESETDVRVEFDDSVAGEQRRFVFVDAVGISLKMRIELTRFTTSGDFYVSAVINNFDSAGNETTLKLIAYIEVKKDAQGIPGDEILLAAGKALCSTTDMVLQCNSGTIDGVLRFWDFDETILASDIDISNKLIATGENFLDSVYKTGDSSFVGYFDIPAQP